MVADRVTVTSRRAGSDEAWTWASEGQGSYTLEPATREEPGTDIVLHLKADADEYLEPYRLDHLVRKWADFITVPIAIVARRQGGIGQPGHGALAQAEIGGEPKSSTRSSTARSA